MGFDDAIKRGFENAQLAAKNMAEIHAVVRELSESLSRTTSGGIINVEIVSRERFVPDDNPFAAMAHALDPFKRRPGRTIEYQAVCATSRNGGTAELCEIRLSPTGYPITIQYARVNSSISNAEDLSKSLMRMLEHADTGTALLELMKEKGTQ